MTIDSQSEKTARFFDALSENWQDRYISDPDMAARCMRFERALSSVPSGSRILDFGCGSGAIARHLSSLGYIVHGMDMSEGMIEAASRQSSEQNLDWSIYAGQGMINAADASFDAIISSSVLEYVSNIQVLLNEFKRLLKPQGLLVATVPDTRDPVRRREARLQMALAIPGIEWLLRFSRWAEGAEYLRLSINRHSPQYWVKLLTAAGFVASPAPACNNPLLMLTAKNPS